MIYLVKVSNHEYGTKEKEYRIEATTPATAANRAFRYAKADNVFGRKHRLKEFFIKINRI